MFDTNNFKRSVKEWVRTNPRATIAELTDYCEDIIPTTQYQSHGWLVEQTLGWYENVLNNRRHDTLNEADDNAEAD